MQMSNVEQLEGEIRSLAKNLRLGSSIASLYKEVAFEKPALFVRDLLQIVWNARLRDRIARRQAMAGLLASKRWRVLIRAAWNYPQAWSSIGLLNAALSVRNKT